MRNIKLNYLYRDGANYKNFGFIVFTACEETPLTNLNALIESKLIDGTWFYASQWQLPDLHFTHWFDETDHTFHEFEYLELTDEAPNTLLTLAQFKSLVEQTNWI